MSNQKKYFIKEIFGPTVQGEGSYTGTVSKFIRFSGCNKWSGNPETQAGSVCFFCDTDFVGGERLTIRQVLQKLNELGDCKTVVLSGGEPALQLDHDFLSYLKNEGYQVHLETNGSKALGPLHGLLDHVTCSPKQSLEETYLESCDDLKILYPYIRDDITIEAFFGYGYDVGYLQPVDDGDKNLNTYRAVQLLLNHPESFFRLSLQTHKLIGVQ